MNLEITWFILIGLLLIIYVVLDGFDLGVGVWYIFSPREHRPALLKTIAPFWDGNEVWLVTAGGAMFAAFPGWYAALFSGFYLPLFFILIALIVRGVGIEFRSKDENPGWRKFWDWAVCIGSFVPSLLWGVAFANFVHGVPISGELYFAGNFWDLINVYSILGGLTSFTGFLLQGAIFISLKTNEPLKPRAEKAAMRVWIPAVVILVAAVIATYFYTDILTKLGIDPGPVPIGAVLASFVAGWFIYKKQSGWAFGLNTLAIGLTVITFFMTLHPRVLVAINDPILSLTIYNTASGPTTLRTMSVVALIFVPIVLAYQAWSYWIFRKRITARPEDLHY